MYDIAVTIVNYKMKDEVQRCLESLFGEVANSGLNVLVSVIDNASGDEIEKMLAEKFPSAKFLLMAENVGFGKAHNEGIKSAKAKYYFVLNPDTRFAEAGILRRLFDFMEQNAKVGAAGPKQLNPDGSLQHSCYRFPRFWQPFFSRTKFGKRGYGLKINEHFLMRDFDHAETIPVDWVMGSAMFLRGEALVQVGSFDENFFMYAEDSDLCRRLWEAGWPVFYVHDAVLEHAHNRASAKIPGVFRAILKNKLSRIHIYSWLKYNWKWRGNRKFY